MCSKFTLTSEINLLNCIVSENSAFAVSPYFRFKLWTFVFLVIAPEIGKKHTKLPLKMSLFSKWSLKALAESIDAFGRLQLASQAEANCSVIFRVMFIRLEMHTLTAHFIVGYALCHVLCDFAP